jgi:preprotein translocase subunit SecA
MKRGYRRRQIDWTEVRAALVREARSESPRTVEAVAAGFGVTPRQMRQKLPTELNALGDRVRALREQRLIALYAETEARYQAAADALLREGLTVSTKSLQRRSGLKVFASRNNVRARALRAVADRFVQLTAP